MHPLLYIAIAATLLIIIIAYKGIKPVAQAQCAIVERLGKYHKTLYPGLNFIFPFLDKLRNVDHVNNTAGRLKKEVQQPNDVTLLVNSQVSTRFPSDRLDLREQIFDVEEQKVISKDNVQLKVDTVIFYQITEPYKAVYEIGNLPEAIKQISKTTIRNIFGEMDLDISLSSRESLNDRLRSILDSATDKWGVKILRVEIQEIEPPDTISKPMLQQMIAERSRRAEVTAAEADKQSKILKAQGVQQEIILRAEAENKAVILKAEAERQQKILLAEAEKQQSILVAEGQAESIKLVQQATANGLNAIREVLNQDGGIKNLLVLETLKAQKDIAKNLSSGQSTKLFLPTELAGLYGAIGGIKEIFKANPDSNI